MPNSTRLQSFADDVAAISGPEDLRVEDGVQRRPANTEEVARYSVAPIRTITQSPPIEVGPTKVGNSVELSLIFFIRAAPALCVNTHGRI